MGRRAPVVHEVWLPPGLGSSPSNIRTHGDLQTVHESLCEFLVAALTGNTRHTLYICKICHLQCACGDVAASH